MKKIEFKNLAKFFHQAEEEEKQEPHPTEMHPHMIREIADTAKKDKSITDMMDMTSRMTDPHMKQFLEEYPEVQDEFIDGLDRYPHLKNKLKSSNSL